MDKPAAVARYNALELAYCFELIGMLGNMSSAGGYFKVMGCVNVVSATVQARPAGHCRSAGISMFYQ